MQRAAAGVARAWRGRGVIPGARSRARRRRRGGRGRAGPPRARWWMEKILLHAGGKNPGENPGKIPGSVRGVGWKFLSTVSKDLLGKESLLSILVSPIKGDFGPKSPGIFFWPPEKSRENKKRAKPPLERRPPGMLARDLVRELWECSARRGARMAGPRY